MPPNATPKTTTALVTPGPTNTYANSYARLSTIAEKLRSSTAPSVDSLVEDLRAAREAYEVCKERLASVRREIEAEIAITESGQV